MTYVLLSLFWTLAGLAVGYWLGRAGRPEAPMPDSTTPAPEPATAAASAPAARRWRDQALGGALIVLAVLSVTAMAVVLTNQQNIIERQAATVVCQNAYNEAFASALEERNIAGAQEREGQRRLLDASFSPDRDRTAVIDAYRQYRALLAEADERRSANPLPTRVC